MEPVTLVISALVAEAAAGLTKTAETAIGEAYQTLKRLVVGRLRGVGTDEQTGTVLVEKVAESEESKTAMSQALTSAGVDDPTREAAQRLLDLLQVPQGSSREVLRFNDPTAQVDTAHPIVFFKPGDTKDVFLAPPDRNGGRARSSSSAKPRASRRGR